MLSATSIDPHPLREFEKWYEIAKDKDVKHPNAMCISTIDDDGCPDSRYVLMKQLEKDSLIFYTNLGSNKGRQLLHNPSIAVNFYWSPLDIQIRMKGRATVVEDKVADKYFASRSRGSQIGAWASKQSQPLPNRQILMEKVNHFAEKFEGKEVPRPDHWSGFRVTPHMVEVWQSGENRLHQRFRYRLQDTKWKITQLYP